MVSKLVVTALAMLIVAATPAIGDENMALKIPSAKAILAKLHPDHPRIMARGEDFERVKTRVANDPMARRWFAKVRKDADKLLAAEPSKYEIPDGKRLLATSRRVLDRVTTLAMVYRLSGDKKYADRAWTELSAAAKFKDWNPPHFLDTAEMTQAFSIGYDWLFDVWTARQKETLRRAIVTHGLEPGLACHEGRGKSNWWPRCSHNWNQVCNGGLVSGALAIADLEPELAGKILTHGLRTIQQPMAEFAPDGAWAEGPGYWHYAVRYNVYLLASLESALGTDFGLSGAKGFDETGTVPIYMTSPMGETFNVADVGRPHRIRAPQMFYLAAKFGRPHYAEWQFGRAKPDALDLLWMPDSVPKALAPLPLAKYFRGCDVVTMRSAWGDRDALFVGFKAGSNAVNHSHLDLGSFVIDSGGVRWAIDLGSDNYNMPRYFSDDTRWTYYRLRAEGHNTLVLNPDAGADQPPKARTAITRFETTARRTTVTADLTPAYARHARGVERTIEMTGGNRVTLTDKVEMKAPGDLWWFWHTQAEVTLSKDARTATLSQKGKTVRVAISGPKAATFEVMPARPLPTSPNPSCQNANKGVRKLAIHLAKVKKTTIRVLVEPVTK
jgi:Heparinase II/III-like protein/Domain of unknown function (DUF4962)